MAEILSWSQDETHTWLTAAEWREGSDVNVSPRGWWCLQEAKNENVNTSGVPSVTIWEIRMLCLISQLLLCTKRNLIFCTLNIHWANV